MSLWLKVAMGVAGLVAAGLVVVAVWTRVAPVDAATWHVDPLSTAAETGKPNQVRLAPPGADVAVDIESPVWQLAPGELMARVDAVALAEPRTRLLAGDPASGFATYLQRSAVFGFPDFISVKAVEVEGGTALAIWSRARDGHSDLGVNRARVERWLAALN